jgi:hypothetical protein
MSPQPLLPTLDKLRGHLADHDLPTVVSVIASAQRVSMQISGHDSDTDLCADLLAWARTLLNPHARLWPLPDVGGMAHLTVSGDLPGGLPIEVFGAGRIATLRSAGLTTHNGGTVPMDVLHTVAGVKS